MSVGEATSLKKNIEKKKKEKNKYIFLVLIGSIPKSNRIEIQKISEQSPQKMRKIFVCLLPNSQRLSTDENL